MESPQLGGLTLVTKTLVSQLASLLLKLMSMISCCWYRSRDKGEAQVRKIVEAGITTFVCLQVQLTATVLHASPIQSMLHVARTRFINVTWLALALGIKQPSIASLLCCHDLACCSSKHALHLTSHGISHGFVCTHIQQHLCPESSLPHACRKSCLLRTR